MILDPTIRGGGTIRYPVPQNGMMTNRNLPMDMNKNRYEKPVQTPSRGAEVANPECVKIEQRLKMTTARCPIPRNETKNNRSWPKDVNKNRYEKPVQTPYWGAEVTNPDCITFEQKIKTTAARCPIPQNGMTNNRSWPKDINRSRYEKPVQTPSRGAEVTKPDCVTIEQRMKTTAAEVCWNLADKAELSRCQETAVAAVGAGTGGTTNVRGRLIDCNKRSTTARTLPTNCGEFVKPKSVRVSPVVTETAPTDGTGVMQYQWNVRESVETTEMPMPSNYLEIPELRLPRVFLDLAEEARNVKVENGLSCLFGGSSAAGNRISQTGFCDSYGGQSTGTEEEGFENHRYLYRNDTEHKSKRTT